MSDISEKTFIVLRCIAQGYSYEKILKENPDMSYMDIFTAAQEVLDHFQGIRRSKTRKDEDRYAEIRKTYPRAYESWTDEEDEQLRRMVMDGLSEHEIVMRLQRQPGAIQSRITKLGLVNEVVKHSLGGETEINNEPWTDEDERELAMLLQQSKGLANIATILQRRPSFIRKKITELRAKQKTTSLTSSTRDREIYGASLARHGDEWLIEEDEKLIQWVESGVNDKEIAERLRRTRLAVRSRIGKIRNNQLGQTRKLGVHPLDNQPVFLQLGKFEPYLRHNEKTIPLPHHIHPLSITIDRAVELLKKR